MFFNKKKHDVGTPAYTPTTGGNSSDQDSAYATYHEQHSLTTLAPSNDFPHSDDLPPRELTRTPPPTEEEIRELQTGIWRTIFSWRFWLRKNFIPGYLIAIVLLVITLLTTVYHTQVVHWLTPVAIWLRDKFTFGWVVPILVLTVISFPPLFGHEIIAVLCGLVWGLWAGFAIVAAGTFIGEVLNFYVFNSCCSARGGKYEKASMVYGCFAKVVREGGIWIAVICRLSLIPGHLTTSVFATCGMGIIVFALAAILSMPKQLVIVYLGVVLEKSGTGQTDQRSRIISDIVLAVSGIITILALWYIVHKMDKAAPDYFYAKRKARQAKLLSQTYYSGSAPFSSADDYNPDPRYKDPRKIDQEDSEQAMLHNAFRSNHPSSVTLPVAQPQSLAPIYSRHDEEQG